MGGSYEPANAALVAVSESSDGSLELAAPDILHDLTPAKEPIEIEVGEEARERVRMYVMANVQFEMTEQARAERKREVEIRRTYLGQSFEISSGRLASAGCASPTRSLRGGKK